MLCARSPSYLKQPPLAVERDSRQSVLLCARPPIAIWAPSNCLRSSQNHTLPSHSVEETDSHPNTSSLLLTPVSCSFLYISCLRNPFTHAFTCPSLLSYEMCYLSVSSLSQSLNSFAVVYFVVIVHAYTVEL